MRARRNARRQWVSLADLLRDLASEDEGRRRSAGEALVQLGHGVALDRAVATRQSANTHGKPEGAEPNELERAIAASGVDPARLVAHAFDDACRLLREREARTPHVGWTDEELAGLQRRSALERLILAHPRPLAERAAAIGERLSDPVRAVADLACDVLDGLEDDATPAAEALFEHLVGAARRTPGLLPRVSAVRALARICRRDAVLLLRVGELLRATAPDSVAAAALVLEHVGPPARILEDELVRAVQDEWAGGNAIDALAAIAPDDERVAAALAWAWSMTAAGGWRRARIVVAARAFPSHRALFAPLLDEALRDDSCIDERVTMAELAASTLAALDRG